MIHLETRSYSHKFLIKSLALLFIFAILHQLLIFSNLNLNVYGTSDLTAYRAIDLYTQKEPFSGKGKNQPSDAFAPQEEVILYAYVTYRDDPVPGKIVAFEVHGPPNPYENISFTQAAITNENGLANVSFRISWPNGHFKETVFGTWNAIASVDIAGVIVSDSLSFMVGWIIELVEIETVDAYNFSKIAFLRNERMFFRLTVKNIAMTWKTATIIIDVYDNLSFPLGQVILKDEMIKLGITILFIEGIVVPERACLGEGTVYANAYTTLPSLGGVPWCPQIFTKFYIMKVVAHDVAVINVFPSVSEAYVCEKINVTVVVRNEGDATETFNVHAYYDSTLIGTTTVVDLLPKTEKTLNFVWSTSNVCPGNYTLSAVADVVPGEIDIGDNRYVDGIVHIKAAVVPPPTPVEYVIPRWLLAWLFLLTVLVGIILALIVILLLLCVCRRKREEDEKAPAPTPIAVKPFEEAYGVRKKCKVCGREFPGVYTFCPYCMSFHGKDY